ncbi:MAG: hypothetical protein KDK24_06950 [Pseudooceanicola sp.]|nr:hypothetical protein [Pseudooceanicola sp.]
MQTLPTAREVIADPARFADRPELYRPAWIVHLAELGRSVRIDRLDPPRHAIFSDDTPLLSRIRARAAALGWPASRTIRCPGART